MAMAIIDGYKVGGVDEPTVADEYNEEREWEVGEFCIYNSTLYKCNTATTGEFDSDSWDVTSCGLEMKGINSNLTDLETLDFSNTSIEPTTSFNGVVQKLMDKLFPAFDGVLFGANYKYDNVTWNVSNPANGGLELLNGYWTVRRYGSGGAVISARVNCEGYNTLTLVANRTIASGWIGIEVDGNSQDREVTGDQTITFNVSGKQSVLIKLEVTSNSGGWAIKSLKFT